jgi:tetratricopeptide (TPR) repeat protein
MRTALFFSAAILSLAAGSASAQVLVLGDSTAATCYQAAEYGTMGMRDGFEVCTQALNVPGLSLRDRAGTYVNRAVIRMRAGDYNGALNDSESGIRMIQSLGEAHVNRGAALLNLSRPQEALQAINTGVAHGSSKMHLVLYNRGAARELTGDVRGAYFDYQESSRLAPNFTLARDQLMRFSVVRRAAQTEVERQQITRDDGMYEDVVALRGIQGRTAAAQ